MPWLLILALASCGPDPTEPPCYDLTVGELNVDSLEAEGWTTLPGDTIAVRPCGYVEDA